MSVPEGLAPVPVTADEAGPLASTDTREDEGTFHPFDRLLRMLEGSSKLMESWLGGMSGETDCLQGSPWLCEAGPVGSQGRQRWPTLVLRRQFGGRPDTSCGCRCLEWGRGEGVLKSVLHVHTHTCAGPRAPPARAVAEAAVRGCAGSRDGPALSLSLALLG